MHSQIGVTTICATWWRKRTFVAPPLREVAGPRAPSFGTTCRKGEVGTKGTFKLRIGLNGSPEWRSQIAYTCVLCRTLELSDAKFEWDSVAFRPKDSHGNVRHQESLPRFSGIPEHLVEAEHQNEFKPKTGDLSAGLGCGGLIPYLAEQTILADLIRGF